MIASLSPCSAYRRLVDACSNPTADVHGQYSVTRLEELYEYETKTPVWRVLLVCGFTPALAVILIVLTDTMPLQDPALGLSHSYLLWLRAFITIFFISGPSLVQLRFIIPNLNITLIEVAILAGVSSAAAVAAQFAFAHIIGYPVPFALVIGTPSCLFVMVSGIFLPRRELLKSKLRLRQQLKDFVNMWICQITLTVVYPVYAYMFKQLSPRAQTAFVLLLPVIKLLNKHWLYRSLRDADDLKPEIAVFNVEVFNALYVAVCMQSSRSIYTTIAFMVIDLLQASHSTYKVANLLNEVRKLVEETQAPNGSSKRPSSVLIVAVATVKGDAQLRKNFRGRSHFVDANAMKKRGSSSTTSGGVLASIHPQPKKSVVVLMPPPKLPTTVRIQPTPTPQILQDPISVKRQELVQKTLHLLFITEFFVLVEYTEVIIPIIYNVCREGMIRLPNRQYYFPLVGKTDMQLAQTFDSVAIYGALEFLSLLTFGVLLQWKLRFSVLTQVAFVLERHAVLVQSKLVMWTFYVVQSSLQHFGADFSFSFSWLHSSTADDS